MTRNPKPLIAKEDIHCYKYLIPFGSIGASPVYNFSYNFDTLYTENHPYIVYNDQIDMFEISSGVFHVRKCDDLRHPLNAGAIAYKAIIPKGSKYWIDDNGLDMCSNMIIVLSSMSWVKKLLTKLKLCRN